MFKYAATCGVDVGAVLRALDLRREDFAFERRVSTATVSRAWLDVAALTGDPSFGLHVAQHLVCGEYDVLGYAFHFSESLGDGLDRIQRFYRVLGDALANELTVEGPMARLRHLRRVPRHEAEAHLASVVLAARAHTGAPFEIREVRFAHAASAQTRHHAEVFRAPVRFGCAFSEILFPARVLTLRQKTANRGLGRVLDRYMEEILATLPRSEGFVERARAAIAGQLRRSPERPSLAATARELRASPRTVQRRLRAHEISHAELVDGVRREMAESMVADRRMQITEIALLLGFSDASGFRRAYERWTGVVPSRARRR
jgi:AraC-like DNA-binding protein